MLERVVVDIITVDVGSDIEARGHQLSKKGVQISKSLDFI